MSLVTSQAVPLGVSKAALPGRARRGGVLYPNLYAWYILAATLDVVVTHAILHSFGGSEVNRIANALIERFGVIGMVALKYSSIVLVVSICEVVGRRNLGLGRRLAVVAIALSAFPVGIGLLKVWQWSRLPTPMIETCEVDEGELAMLAPRHGPARFVIEADAPDQMRGDRDAILASW